MIITFGFLTPTALGIVLVIALILFGPGKLPELGKSLGRGIKEFKSETEGKPKTEIILAEHNDDKNGNVQSN